MRGVVISSLSKLYKELDDLYPKMPEYCKICKSCCKSYGWLLPEEADDLYEKDIPILKINDMVYCIDSFKKIDGKINLGKDIPRCRFYDENFRCTIYENRPLICRFYPLEVVFEREKVKWVVSKDCLYIQSLNDPDDRTLKERIKNLLSMINDKLLTKIMENYYNIAMITDQVHDTEVIEVAEFESKLAEEIEKGKQIVI